jgi:hypothetical protein
MKIKIYRVNLRSCQDVNRGESTGIMYFTNKREALKAFREDNTDPIEHDFMEIQVETSKKGILQALNTYGGHPDNGWTTACSRIPRPDSTLRRTKP